MADTIRVLAQAFPASGVLTDIYTAPKRVVVSSVVICNQDANDTTFRIAIAVAGVADTEAQYLYRGTLAAARDIGPFIATIGVTLAIGDVLRAYSENGKTSFNVFGIETA
jgi:predicted membrane-bound mannosyltransferase